MTVEEANRIAMKLAEDDRFFVQRSLREWAQAIGCSDGLVVKLPLWRETMRLTGRGKEGKDPSPKIVSLTDALEAVSAEGTRDEVVHNLADEEQTCREAGLNWEDLSPQDRQQIQAEQKQDDDQADSGPGRGHNRRRL